MEHIGKPTSAAVLPLAIACASLIDTHAKAIKPQNIVHNRYLVEMVKSGFMDQLWAKK